MIFFAYFNKNPDKNPATNDFKIPVYILTREIYYVFCC